MTPNPQLLQPRLTHTPIDPPDVGTPDPGDLGHSDQPGGGDGPAASSVDSSTLTANQKKSHDAIKDAYANEFGGR